MADLAGLHIRCLCGFFFAGNCLNSYPDFRISEKTAFNHVTNVDIQETKGNITTKPNVILEDSWGDPINPKELPQQPIQNHSKASYRYLNCNLNNLKNIYAQYMYGVCSSKAKKQNYSSKKI